MTCDCCGPSRMAVFVTRCEKLLCNECVYGWAPSDDPKLGVHIHCECPSPPTLAHIRLMEES